MEFSQKQKDIKTNAKKKKKKKKKKATIGITGGQALDADDEDVSVSQYPGGIGASEIGSDDDESRYEEHKKGVNNITNMSKTRIGDINEPSYLD